MINGDKNITLLQNWFNSDKRHHEYIECLRKNDENSRIDKIILLCNDKHDDLKSLSSKVTIVKVKQQPTYADYIKYANKHLKGDICIIANSDIYFTDTIRYANSYVDGDTVIALSRCEIRDDNTLTVMPMAHGSQDSWMFESPFDVTDMNADFKLGIGGCDHRIAFEFAKHYEVVNPCFKIHSIHVHESDYREWRDNPILPQRDGYKFVPPHGKSCISFSMFTPKKQYIHREWDDHNGVIDRYWYNIPALVAVYKAIHPDFTIKINLSKDIENHPKFKMLVDMQANGLLTYNLIDLEYTGIEPTLWRYEPIFNPTMDVVFIRDIDSVPNSAELMSNALFIESNAKACTIRSHTGHSDLHCVMLAGLCGFKPYDITHVTDFPNFLAHYTNKKWGCDQWAIAHYTQNVLKLTGDEFIDFALESDGHTLGESMYGDCRSIRNPSFELTPNGHAPNNTLFETLDGLTKWAGEPVDSRGDVLNSILNDTLNVGAIIRDIIKNNDLSRFYKI